VTLEGLSEELDEEDTAVFEQICSDFLDSKLQDIRALQCSIQEQSIDDDALELEVLVSGRYTGGDVDEVQFGSTVVGVLNDNAEDFVNALREGSATFDDVTGITVEEVDGQILGLDRNIFVVLAAGVGVALIMLCILCASAPSNKAPVR